jgi:hypothetical protein
VQDSTVIRAYGGRTFGAVKTTGGSTHFEGLILNRNYSSSDNSILDFPTMLDKGLPPWPVPPFIDPTIANNIDVHFWQRSDAGRPSEYWTWNLDIQQQLSPSMVFTAGLRERRGRTCHPPSTASIRSSLSTSSSMDGTC